MIIISSSHKHASHSLLIDTIDKHILRPLQWPNHGHGDFAQADLLPMRSHLGAQGSQSQNLPQMSIPVLGQAANQGTYADAPGPRGLIPGRRH